jgi:hypothetical protein
LLPNGYIACLLPYGYILSIGHVGPARVGRIVLTPCEVFDNPPPWLTGKTLTRTGKLPPRVFGMFMQQCGFGRCGGSRSRSGG